MTTIQELAEASNALVYSAMAAYSASFVAYSLDLASMGRRSSDTNQEQPTLVTSGAAAPQSAPTSQPTPQKHDNRAPRKAAGAARALLWLAVLFHLGSATTRGLSVSRVPWANMYEFSLTGSLLVGLIFCLILAKPRLAGLPRGYDAKWLGAFITGPIVLTLGLAVTKFYTEASQLVPALQEKFFLHVHVFIASLSAAIFTVGFSLTVLQLVQQRRERTATTGTPAGGRFMNAIPGSTVLESMAHRMTAFAFPMWMFTIVAGAIWAQKAWGRYWAWDPKEVGSFVVFVAYAAYLHARATAGWSKKAAWINVLAFILLILNSTVVNLLPGGLHSYADVE